MWWLVAVCVVVSGCVCMVVGGCVCVVVGGCMCGGRWLCLCGGQWLCLRGGWWLYLSSSRCLCLCGGQWLCVSYLFINMTCVYTVDKIQQWLYNNNTRPMSQIYHLTRYNILVNQYELTFIY